MEVEWKLETENENGNWKRKWKCANRWCVVLHMRKVQSIAVPFENSVTHILHKFAYSA